MAASEETDVATVIDGPGLYEVIESSYTASPNIIGALVDVKPTAVRPNDVFPWIGVWRDGSGNDHFRSDGTTCGYRCRVRKCAEQPAPTGEDASPSRYETVVLRECVRNLLKLRGEHDPSEERIGCIEANLRAAFARSV